MLLIPNALFWSSRKCNCACALPAEVQLRLRVTRRSWQKLFAGKNCVKILVTAQTQLRSYSEQQRAFGNRNICNCYVIRRQCVMVQWSPWFHLSTLLQWPATWRQIIVFPKQYNFFWTHAKEMQLVTVNILVYWGVASYMTLTNVLVLFSLQEILLIFRH